MQMILLLDTHVVLWAFLNPALLSKRVAAMLADQTNTALVSAATAWEIATKVRIGKLALAERLEQDLLRNLERGGYSMISVDPSHALRAARLTGSHNDPWDRMIAAQALEMDIPLLSIDSALDQFGVRRIW